MQPMKLLHKKKGEDMFQMYSFVSLITPDELVETLFSTIVEEKNVTIKPY